MNQQQRCLFTRLDSLTRLSSLVNEQIEKAPAILGMSIIQGIPAASKLRLK